MLRRARALPQGRSKAAPTLRWLARQADVVGCMAALRTARPEVVNEQLQDGWTPLMFACDRQDSWAALEVVKLLLSAGAHVNLQHWQGATALMVALDAGSEAVVALLLAARADVTLRDVQGGTALHVACKRGLHASAALLLAAGGDGSAQTVLGKTPLHYAVCGAGSSGGSLPTVRILLAAGVHLHAVDGNGNTPLHAAAGASVGPEADAIALALVGAGGSVFAQNSDGLTPPQHAKRMGHARRAGQMTARASRLRRWGTFRVLLLLDRGRAEMKPPSAVGERGEGWGSERVDTRWAGLLAHLAPRPDLTRFVYSFV